MLEAPQSSAGDQARAQRRYHPIADYAAIGNCRVLALISRDGSLDWLCLPRFDSPSVFARILDADRGGSFSIRPITTSRISRRYLGPTNVLETTFATPTGVLRLTDCMPVSSASTPRKHLWPDHEVIRRADCVQGEVQIAITCDPRPDYGAIRPIPRRLPPDGWTFEGGHQRVLLRSEVPLTPRPGIAGVHATHVLRAGERAILSLSSDAQFPAVLPSLGHIADRRVAVTTEWWRGWAERCLYRGPWGDIVLRSALALKLLCFAPSGAMIAAPTTSLPELVGGERNWDYRYCWLRDASLVIRALLQLGYTDEAESFLSWLLHATRLTWPRLGVLYNVFGETFIPERTLDLEGYRGSRPVRIGNAARNQLQLDVYGAVVDAAYQFVIQGGRLDRTSGRMLAGLGRTAAKLWKEPDEGIWEPRSGRLHHTLSKAMCCIALERLIALHQRGEVVAPVIEFRSSADEIRRVIAERGVDPQRGCYRAAFDHDATDASLLLLALYRYEDPRSPRLLATLDRVLGALSADSLLYRYHHDDGIRGGEAAFGISSFWAVEALALAGRIDQATRRFDTLCGYANDVGLFAEEIEPGSGGALGNFPQAFTHVGLINAAHTLAAARPDLPSPPTQQAAGRKT